jgi:hypothetical protein
LASCIFEFSIGPRDWILDDLSALLGRGEPLLDPPKLFFSAALFLCMKFVEFGISSLILLEDPPPNTGLILFTSYPELETCGFPYPRELDLDPGPLLR